jgi:3-dehydroquinate synthase
MNPVYQIRLQTESGGTDIEVGVNLSRRLKEVTPVPTLLVDENVMRFHAGLFETYPVITIPSGEEFKSMETVMRIYRELVEREADRTSLLVGVGGGLTTDLAGFVGSTFLRGVSFGFISTTLLGQVDASIGGKNGINLDGYKNMVGTIRQPAFIWCDLSLLHSLERREFIAGIAEVIKYGAIRDARFLRDLREQLPALLELDSRVLEKVVTTSAALKVEVVQKDEKESDLRRILNFGHTIGHALERELKVLHGEAVATGMVMAARLSHALGYLASADADLISDLVTEAGLPGNLKADPDVIFENIRKDKKKQGDAIHFVLLEGLGNAQVKSIPLRDLKHMLHDLC